MASFQELRNGGRFSMTTKYSALPTPVHVYPNRVDKRYILVKYLSVDGRGSMMGLDESQVKHGLCTFSKKSTELVNKIPDTNCQDDLQKWMNLRDTMLLIGVYMLLGLVFALITLDSTNKIT